MESALQPPSARLAISNRVGSVVDSVAHTCHRFASSNAFFAVIVVAYLLGALWIAWSAQYQLLYDEFYHVGLTHLFAASPSPFIEQPAATGLGDVERLPSYLYHYLLSFPLRIAEALGASDYAQVVLLRTITVLMNVSSLFVFRKIMDEFEVPRAIGHTALVVYAVLPITTFVAATINYDNLLLPLGSLYLLLAYRAFRAPSLPLNNYLWLGALGVAACLTKFTFLPIFAITVLLILGTRVYRHWGEPIANWLPRPAEGARWVVSLLPSAIVAAIALALFIERYGVNLLAYGSPAPECDAIHPEAVCEPYPPWRRNHELDADYPDQPASLGSAAAYFARFWILTFIQSTHVVGVGAESSFGAKATGYIILGGVFAAIIIASLTLSVILRRPGFAFIAVVSAVYLAVIFQRNYSEFLRFGSPLAIQGRYLLLILVPLIAAVGVGLATILNSNYKHALAIKVLVLVGVVVVATQGGGVLTFMVGAKPGWYAPESPLAGINDFLIALGNLIVVV